MRVVASIICLLCFGGCVPIPPGHSPFSRANVPKESPNWLEPGHTTMIDVLYRLGEPDDASPDQRTLGWVNIDGYGGGLLFLAFGPSAMGGVAIIENFRRLAVRFGADGIVTERWVQSATCTSGTWGIANRAEDFGGNCLPPLTNTAQPPR